MAHQSEYRSGIMTRIREREKIQLLD